MSPGDKSNTTLHPQYPFTLRTTVLEQEGTGMFKEIENVEYCAADGP